MMMTTVVAVALGLTPVNATEPQRLSSNYPASVGRFSQSVDKRGTTHVRGYAPTGTPYELTMDRNGYVEASVADRVVTFRVQEVG